MIINRYLFYILILKTIGTLVAFFIYSKFVTLGDAKGYAENHVPFSFSALFDRTEFTEILYSTVQIITMNTFLTYLLTSLFVGYVIFSTFKNTNAFKSAIFWISISSPHFLIWTGVSTKEALTVIIFLILIKYIVMIFHNEKVNKKALLIILIMSMFFRPHYGLAYLYLLLSCAIISSNTSKQHKPLYSTGSHFVISLILLISIIICIAMTYSSWYQYLEEVMATSKSFFVGFDSLTTRYYLMEEWSGINDFLNLLVNGVFMSLVGPTFSESMNRPAFFPVFLEGITYIFIVVYLIIKLLRVTQVDNKFRLMFFYAFIPSIILILLAHYPFGIFNPGTAIRYKQSITPLLIFFPIMMLYKPSTLKNL